MSNYTFLSEEQIFGQQGGQQQLGILQKRGTKAAITDFAILLGGYVSNSYHIDTDNSLAGRTGWYWTKSDNGSFDARAVSFDGSRNCLLVLDRLGGGRPALPLSSIDNIPTNGESGQRAVDGVFEYTYGYYPQTAVSKSMQDKLTLALNSGELKKLKKGISTDSKRYGEYDREFSRYTHGKYEYQGKQYVRVKANFCVDVQKTVTLSNGESYHNGDYVWVEVEPVKRWLDEEAQISITEKIIFAGAQFHHEQNYQTADFEKTDIKKFMDEYMAPEMDQQIDFVQKIEPTKEEIEAKKRKKNPYQFHFEQVSEEEIIKGAVQSGVAVLLHGPSSEGKSARVKQLDPDCEIIYLRNATPESLNGKSIAMTDQGIFDRLMPLVENGTLTLEQAMETSRKMIDVKPTWLQNLERKCAEEPGKIHIVFFDEITNALPSIQGMAFNIVLDQEVNGKWKLPENARIVAAGNELSDSLAANELAEPLFNRFAHVYIKTTVESWLKWAAMPKESYQRLDYKPKEAEAKIHPAIYAYIAYKGEKVLRTPYNGRTPNADPRKWEMASRFLEANGQPQMLRALIGKELTQDFVDFCKKQVIGIEDVVAGNYTSQDLKMNLAEKYATAVGLSAATEEQMKKVRNFMIKLGPEPLATFENLWIRGDEKRLEKIAELRLMELSEGGKENEK